jgi:hypothetical protein
LIMEEMESGEIGGIGEGVEGKGLVKESEV